MFKIHFSTEERYMREAQYPQVAEHQQEHEQFITQVSKLVQDVENKEPHIENEVLSFLKRLVPCSHIRNRPQFRKMVSGKGYFLGKKGPNHANTNRMAGGI